MLTFHAQASNPGPDHSPKLRNRAVIHQLRHSEVSEVDLTSTLLEHIKIREVVHEPLNFEDGLPFHGVVESDLKDGKKSFYDSAYF